MRGNHDRVSNSFDTLRPLQRGLLRFYSLLLLFLGRCNRFLHLGLPVLIHVLLLRFHIFFSGITVALATESKAGISTHPVPSELKLDGGGEGESICVRVRSRGGGCAPLVVDSDAKPAAFRLGGGAGR